MPEELIPLVVIPVLFGTIAFITKTISDNRVKRELISMRADKETIDYLMLQSPIITREGSLKWGIVAVALGAGLAFIQMLGLDAEQPMTYALMFISGGAGLLTHYFLPQGSD